jgi:hypothetical protein
MILQRHLTASTDSEQRHLPFEQLISSLKANGFLINVNDFIEFTKAFQQFGTDDPQDLKYYLAPLVCRKQEEQQSFYRIYDQWLQDERVIIRLHSKKRWIKRIRLALYILFGLLGLYLIWYYVQPTPIPKIEICISKEIVHTGDTVIFSEGCKRSEAVGKGVSFKWTLDDSSVVTQTGSVTHVYKKPKIYNIRLEEFDQQQRIATKDTFLTVCNSSETLPVIPAQVDSGKQVVIQPLQRPLGLSDDSLIWVISNTIGESDTLPYAKKALQYKALQTGDYTVYLLNKNESNLNCPLGTASFSVNDSYTSYSLTASPPAKPLEVGHLLSNQFPLWSSLIGAMIVLVIFWIIDLRRKNTVQLPQLTEFLASGRKKPIDIPFENKDKLIRQETNLIRAFSELRQRTSSDLISLDIHDTISKTIYHHGLFSPVFKAGKEEYEYLFLIDASGIFNQQIYLFTFLANVFIKENIQITSYYFYRDITVFYNATKTQSFSLQDLWIKHQRSVLILISDGYRLINKAFPALITSMANELGHWEKRVLVTPVPALDWKGKEDLLSKLFRLVPADLEGWIGIIKLISGDHLNTVIPYDWKKVSAKGIDFENISGLRKYLGDEDLFQWVCALAIHHRVRWEVTLSIGKDLLEAANATQKLSYTNLLKLARITWLKYGAFPSDIRLDLLTKLEPEKQILARKTMLNLLKESDHLITEDSFSYNEKRMQIYTDSFIIYGHDEHSHPELKENALKFASLWQSGAIADLPLKTYLLNKDKKWETPLQVSQYGSKITDVEEVIQQWQTLPFQWKWPNPLYAVLTFCLLFAFLPLIDADWLYNSSINKILPMSVIKGQVLAEVSVALDTNTCSKLFTRGDTVISMNLKTPSGALFTSIQPLKKQANPVVTDATNVSKQGIIFNFSNVPLSMDPSALLSVTIKGSNGKSLQIDMSNGYKQYHLGITGQNCRPLGRLVYIQYDGNADPGQIEQVRQCISAQGYSAPGIEKITYMAKNVIRYLIPEMKVAADSLAVIASNCIGTKVVSEYIPWRPRNSTIQYDSKQLEIWLNGNQNCHDVRFDSLLGIASGNLYYNASMSHRISLYRDSIVSNLLNKKSYPISSRVKDCGGAFTFYLLSNVGKVVDSTSIAFPVNGLYVLSGSNRTSESYNLLFNPRNLVPVKKLTDYQVLGSWHTSTNQRVVISTNSISVNGSREDYGMDKVYYDRGNNCYIYFVSNDYAGFKNFRIIVNKLVQGGNYISINKVSSQLYNNAKLTELLKSPATFSKITRTVRYDYGMLQKKGIIFYLDTTQEHGLMCSTMDLDSAATWFDALTICKKYRGGGYKGWHLPTKDEITKLYVGRSFVSNLSINCTNDNFGNCSYWSSTEIDKLNAWNVYFTSGVPWSNYRKTGKARVRAVRRL